MTSTAEARLALWAGRADLAQDSVSALYGASQPQLLHNTHPADDDTLFNYWWLAHAIDCRIDAFERTAEVRRRDEAAEIAANIRERNGSLVNDYFDDMLWYGLALLRLAEISEGEAAQAAERDAVELWEHVLAEGWTDIHGPSVSWRRQQPDYKNTPANGPFIILGARLARRTGRTDLMPSVRQSMAWLEEHLVREDGFVWDGLGREGGDAIDTEWMFTYNPGLYLGACVEMFRSDGDERWLDRAERTALVSIAELARDGVFVRDGGDLDDRVPEIDGGDTGLFKGIWYRYAAQLLEHREIPEVADLVRSSTDVLWDHALVDIDQVRFPADSPAPPSALLREAGVVVRAGDDWRRPAPRLVGFSTQLSAIMALEVRARLDA